MVAVGNRILSVNGQDMEGKGRDAIHAIVRATPPGGEIVFLIKHINECDPDPGVVSLTWKSGTRSSTSTACSCRATQRRTCTRRSAPSQ